ncbi:MAG: universal stress protein, partial [Gammaproteobacteria bacterium]|nr:universal stress protein [Gammaproteobacteria bacterium]
MQQTIKMSYKTILLHLDNEACAPALVKFASQVAAQYSAHLVGLFVIHPIQVYVGRAGGVGISSDLSSLLAKEQFDLMKKLEDIFNTETQDQDHPAEWRFIDERACPVAETLLQETTAADLLIIGHQSGNSFSGEIAHSALLASPVPVLVVPEQYEATAFAKNVLVAWDGKTEAARAVCGAKSVLQNADNVWLHHVRTSLDKDVVMSSNMKCVAENMSRHDIKVEISESTAEKKEIGNTLSGVIRDHGVDCVVMGAYGHSRIRNLLLGTTTDYALNQLNVPLLMW